MLVMTLMQQDVVATDEYEAQAGLLQASQTCKASVKLACRLLTTLGQHVVQAATAANRLTAKLLRASIASSSAVACFVLVFVAVQRCDLNSARALVTVTYSHRVSR